MIYIDLCPVQERVVIRIVIQGFGEMDIDLCPVSQSVVVRIVIIRVGKIYVLLIVVGQTVTVGIHQVLVIIGVQGVMIARMDLHTVQSAAAIGIGVQRIGIVIPLQAVPQPVPVGIEVKRVGMKCIVLIAIV